MAGFRAGLVHGTLMCAATLAALSLAFPREDASDAPPAGGTATFAPERPSGAVASAPGTPAGLRAGDSASVALAGRSDSGSAKGVDAAAPPAPLAQGDVTAALPAGGLPRDGLEAGRATPAADAGSLPDGAAPDGATQDGAARPALKPLPDPVGSDFRRGLDDPPRAPAALPAPMQGTAPRSLAAGPEPAPAAIPADSPRLPAAPAAPSGIALPAKPEPLDRPQKDTAVTPARPGRVAQAAQDGLPRPSQPVLGTADLSDAPADAGGGAVVVGTGKAADAGRTAPAAAPAKDRASAPDASDDAADGVGVDRQPFASPEAPASSGFAGLARSDAAPAAQALAASSGTDAPPQPFDAPEDRPARSDLPSGRNAAPAADPAPAPRLSLAAPAPAPSAAKRAPRPAPDLSIPRAVFAPGAARAVPALPQPAGTTPPAPDLSDLLPEGRR